MTLDVAALSLSEGPRLRAWFGRRLTTGDPTLADDLVQATLLRAWERRDRYHDVPGARPSSWLWAIARHTLADHFRDRRRPVVPDRSLEARAACGLDPCAPDWTPLADERIVVTEALDRLTERQRAVVVARFYEGRRQRDLAHIATYYGVKKLQDRALVNLRKLLEVA
jgi:RNA polymerase sigma-70 factor (ECF subfamily)